MAKRGIEKSDLYHLWVAAPAETASEVGLMGSLLYRREKDQEREITTKAISTAIASLSIRDQQIITLYFFENCSIEEIANLIDVRVVSAKIRLQRALSRLRKLTESEVAKIEAEPTERTISEDAEAEDGLSAAEKAFAKLPSELREVLGSHLIQGHTITNIANQLGISKIAAFRLIHRAKTALKKKLLQQSAQEVEAVGEQAVDTAEDDASLSPADLLDLSNIMLDAFDDAHGVDTDDVNRILEQLQRGEESAKEELFNAISAHIGTLARYTIKRMRVSTHIDEIDLANEVLMNLYTRMHVHADSFADAAHLMKFVEYSCFQHARKALLRPQWDKTLDDKRKDLGFGRLGLDERYELINKIANRIGLPYGAKEDVHPEDDPDVSEGTPEQTPADAPKLKARTPVGPWSKHVADAIATVKDAPYEEKAEQLSGLSHDVRQGIAECLEPDLNKKIQAMPHESYEEKKELAKWVNEELRRFDLAIKCPKTGQPSILLVGTGNHPQTGRFMLEHRTSDSKRVRTVHTPELPHLELMEANPRREAIIEWREKVGRQGEGASRA